jgi:hypothetical protein
MFPGVGRALVDRLTEIDAVVEQHVEEAPVDGLAAFVEHPFREERRLMLPAPECKKFSGDLSHRWSSLSQVVGCKGRKGHEHREDLI